VFTNSQMRENANRLARLRQLIIAGKWDKNFIADSGDIDDRVRGKGVHQFAIEKSDHVKSLNRKWSSRQCASLRFQHERELNLFAFRDVEATRGEEAPTLGMIRKKLLDQRSWNNYETRSRLGHEVDCVLLIESREKRLHT